MSISENNSVRVSENGGRYTREIKILFETALIFNRNINISNFPRVTSESMTALNTP